MRRSLSLFGQATILAAGCAFLAAGSPSNFQRAALPGSPAPDPSSNPSSNYLGFDRNIYPGDAALGLLRQTFSFCGYWLNAPPGETSTTWAGKRQVLVSKGFGFLVLFNGRLDRQLKSTANAAKLGASDAVAAIDAAKREGFSSGTILFLDQEEGGRMMPEQLAYIYAWVDGVNASGYRAGVYGSAMPAREKGGGTVISANDLRDHADGRKIVFFVYNDSCPPSPGCSFQANLPSPQQSGAPFAAIWQFAQSPRRREFTANCPVHYDPDGNCYAPFAPRTDGLYVDVDSATLPDPSSGLNGSPRNALVGN